MRTSTLSRFRLGRSLGCFAFVLALVFVLPATISAQSFVNYESPQVHPIALSADGKRLFVVNTPDSRLAIYSTAQATAPVLLREVFVGAEPVSVRPRTEDEVWVVGYLADAISVVSVDDGTVTATIRVVDEPTDVVFAGQRAFVSVSGSDEVRVFDVTSHTLLGTIPIFGEEPRSLVVSKDGKTVWAVVHRSGNDTTALRFDVAPPPPPPTKPSLPKPPQTALIIDSEDPAYTAKHDVDLPDFDLVEIDVASMQIRKNYAAVGTINFAAAVRPGTNDVWIVNSEARNLVRFVTNLRGHAWDSRVTRVTTSTGAVTPFDLNSGIDYNTLPNNAALSSALARPTDVVWTANGQTMYVAAFGTDRIGIVDPSGQVTGFIEVGNTSGAAVDPRNKRGPRGLALHPSGVLFVLNRLSNSLSAIDPTAKSVLWERALPDPTPLALKRGRGFLYDAKLSGNGTFSCGSCHVDGDTDGIAWDLGNPGGDMFRTRGVNNVRIDLHPMKGPMLTQTLKGLKGGNPFHWRGDKPRLQDFNEAFDSLMGKDELPAADMDEFAAFMETIVFPPNPNLNLDRTLPSQSAKDGRNLYINVPFTGSTTCVSCHSLPTGSNGLINPGLILQIPQAMKVAQLRNVYKRLGFRKTPQGRKSGYGLGHEGFEQDVFTFLGLPVFQGLSGNAPNRKRIADFVEAFDTGTPPTVGYQVTATSANVNSATVTAEIALLIARSFAGDIDLIVKGEVDGRQRGMLYQPLSQTFRQDEAALPAQTLAQLRALVLADRATLTLMGVARGTGLRSGIDRDLDAVLDGDEGVRIYGAGTAGCAGTPFLGASSEPRIGNPWFSFAGTRAPNNAAGMLGIALGSGNFSLLGVKLLIDVASPATAYLAVGTDGAGTLALPLPLPNNANLVGLKTFSQVVWVDSCGPQGVSATQGLEITITK